MGAFTIADYAVVTVYVAASLFIGLRRAGKQATVEDYFVADRSASWWAVGISAVATGLSAISYLGVPAWVFQHDLQYNVSVLFLPVVMLIVIRVFVPVLARMRLMTIYHYLEYRFNLAVRTVASGLFLLLRGGWLATAIYTQGLLISELSSVPMWAAVSVIGAVTAVYTVLGGIRAVLWTDVMQFFVLIGGILAMLTAVLVDFDGDVGRIWELASSGGHTQFATMDLNLVEITIWAIVIHALVENTALYGSDQVMVQRFLTSRSPRDMRWSVMFTGLLSVPVIALLAMLGLGLSAYYQTHPELAASLSNPDRLVPHFIGSVMPPGLSGLVIAGIFAATMSTLSSGFNSLATATVVDFVHRFRGDPAVGHDVQERRDVITAKVITTLWAVLSTAAALLVGGLGTILEIFGKINGLLVGPILGVFLLGLLTRRTGSAAALIAMFAGTAFTVWVTRTSTHWLWYAPAGCAATLLVGVILGRLLPDSHGGNVPSA